MTESVDVVVDSLPYIDADYDAAVVDALVAKERAAMTLQAVHPLSAHHSDVSLFSDHPALRDLLDKASAGTRLQAIDTSRFRLDGPAADTDAAADPAAWAAALDNAAAQLEHQASRLVNLELMAKFGSNAWRVHNYRVQAAVEGLRAEVDAHRRLIEDVNKARQADQMQGRPTLVALRERWNELVNSILAVRYENDRLDAEIAALQAAASGTGCWCWCWCCPVVVEVVVGGLEGCMGGISAQ
ncbi:Pre-mRNA-splicing factor SPF27 [Entophlyctis helioformis]|nr:Pre-mRNA-splicing factor SPF27 [Entophlyctis helioformis]